ncbi:MAG: hypothetical protein HQ568_06420, partial [Calditrichaeota bacterium]|nr:hypothetical protein [Calditrichota bacterium]
MALHEKGVIKNISQISEDIWDITVESPHITTTSKPGQFVHVRIDEEFEPFLRRPLSIGPVDGDTLRLIFLVKGKG